MIAPNASLAGKSATGAIADAEDKKGVEYLFNL
jgi:hypothetical protein